MRLFYNYRPGFVETISDDDQANLLCSVQVTEQPHINQPDFNASCVCNLLYSSSYQSNQSRSIQLFIKSTRNTTTSIHIDSTSSISDLKHIIYAHDGIPPCDQRLMHCGRELRDDALLPGLDVDGGTITCLLRVLGGNPNDQLPVYWWFGFSRSYEDGRAGEEGRSCHVLSEIEFGGTAPANWYSDAPLSDWEGILLHSGSESEISILNLSRFPVKSLPDSIDLLTSLTALYATFCLLSQVPDSIGKMTSLVELHVVQNDVTVLPDSICNLVTLSDLTVCGNLLTHLPESIGNLVCLTHLDVSGNELTALPDSISLLSSLTCLTIAFNLLACLPDSIDKLRSLTHLYGNDNPLTRLPDSIWNLTSLTVLNATNNQLTYLSDSISNLTALESLAIGSNMLTRLPDSIGNITSLTHLFLEGNQLTQLPDSIGNLTSLAYLIISTNPITSTQEGKDEVKRRFERDGLHINF